MSTTAADASTAAVLATAAAALAAASPLVGEGVGCSARRARHSRKMAATRPSETGLRGSSIGGVIEASGAAFGAAFLVPAAAAGLPAASSADCLGLALALNFDLRALPSSVEAAGEALSPTEATAKFSAAAGGLAGTTSGASSCLRHSSTERGRAATSRANAASIAARKPGRYALIAASRAGTRSSSTMRDGESGGRLPVTA